MMLLASLFARGILCVVLTLSWLAIVTPAFGWQLVREDTITSPDGLPDAGANRFGARVALSADGSTLLAGEPGAHRVIAFARTASGWDHEATLNGPAGQDFGDARIAVARDGSVAVIASEDGALVFTRTAGVWAQTAQLGAGPVSDVDVSGDGTRAVVGPTIYDRQGAGWSAGTTVTGLDLLAPGPFGGGATISDDGQTVVMDGPLSNSGAKGVLSSSGPGNLWTFAAGPGGTWPQMGGPLGGPQPEPTTSMALTPDGRTLFNGGRLWERSGSVWNFRGDLRTQITGSSYDLGGAVTMSDDGKVMLAGGGTTESGTWLFVRDPDKFWTQPGPIVTPDEARGGLGLTGDGETAVIGNPEAGNADGDKDVGEVGVFAVEPGNPDDDLGGGGGGGGGAPVGGGSAPVESGGGGGYQPPLGPAAPQPAPTAAPIAEGASAPAALVTVGQVAKLLGPRVVRRSARTLIKRGFRFTVNAPSAGWLKVTWRSRARGKRAKVLASGQVTFAKAGKARLTVRLNRAGRRAVRRSSKKLKITVRGSFTPADGGAAVTVARKATVAR